MNADLASTLAKDARHIVLRSRRVLRGGAGLTARNAVRGRGLSFAEVRQYLPGDDVRSIDWKVTARMGHPFVKSFTTEREQSLWLLVDTSARMRFGSNGRTKEELAIETASILALVAAAQNDRVGLMTFGDRHTIVPPRRSNHQAQRIVRQLLDSPDSPPGVLNAAVHLLRRLARARSLIFVITDGLSRTAPASLQILCKHHEVYFLEVTDPWEQELPDLGLVSFADPGTGKTMLIDTSDHEYRWRYQQAAIDRQRFLHRELSRIHVPWISIRTDGTAADALKTYFHR